MNRCPHCSQNHAAANHFCPVTGLPIPLGPRLVSTKLLDKYTVIQILGEGPIGIVLEVEDNLSKKRFAAKLIHPRFTRDADAAERLMEDVKRTQAISCEHIAQIVQVGRDAGAAIVVIRELMTGECLSSRIEQVGQFSLRAAVSIVREILVALNAIHQVSVINLDLSPADVFLAAVPNGHKVKLVDIGDRHVKQLLLDDAARPVGCNYYAPEQLDRSRQPNLRSDIYAAGMILYQMLTGIAPSRSGNLVPLETARKDIPPDLAQVIAKSIAQMPNNRYQSTAEFMYALDSINWDAPPVLQRPSASSTPPQVGATVSAVPKQVEPETASVIIEMPEIEKRSPVKAIIAIGICLLIAGVAGWYFIFRGMGRSSETTTPPEVRITIQVTPPDAIIYADGKRVSGMPPILKVPADTDLHTIAAKAEGYEPVERDVPFDRSKIVKLELMEIIQPDEPAAPEGKPLPAAVPKEVKNAEPAGKAVEPSKQPVSEPKQAEALGKLKTGSKHSEKAEKSVVEKEKKPKKTTVDKNQKPTKLTPATDRPKVKNLEGFRTTNPFE